MSSHIPAETGKRYAYYPGCCARATAIACEESLLTLFRMLDIGLDEIPDWNCCGATSYMSISRGAAFILAARNLALVQLTGHSEVVAPCSACYLALRKTQDFIEHYPLIRQEVEEALEKMELPFPGNIRVRHPLDVLYEDVGMERIASKVVRSWPAGAVACYYGCQLVRPYSEVDVSYNPTRMDQLLNTGGVQTVQYPLKAKCCGGSMTGTTPDVGIKLNLNLIKEAVRRGAQAIVTICHLCQFNLDVYQAQVSREMAERADIPVLYLTQVLGWVFGGEYKELGFHRSISGQKKLKKLLCEVREEAHV